MRRSDLSVTKHQPEIVKGADVPSNSSVQARAADRDSTLVDFRVVAHKGERYALKLERIFWRVLKVAATAKNERLGAYIAKVVDQCGADENKTSLVRVHVVAWLNQKLIDISAESVTRKTLNNLVNAAPVPCFIISDQNKIDHQNEAFLNLLKQRLEEQSPGRQPEIRISFQSNFSTLLDNLKSSSVNSVRDRLVLHVGAEKSEYQARIVLIETGAGTSLGMLVYLSP